MTFRFIFELIAMPLILLISMWLALQLGTRLRHKHGNTDSEMEGLGVVDGAVFGLMGLLLAFAFSGAASRFDQRRALIAQEANDIGTAWLRIDLLPAPDQPAVRQKFRDYVDARLASFQSITDEAAVREGLATTGKLQGEIWALVVPAAQRSPTTLAGMLLLPSLNDMFDDVTTRTAHMMMHSPLIVFFLLISVLALCSMLAGYRMGASEHWSKLHRLSFVFILAITYYVIVDLEYPRVGLIRVDNYDQLLVQVRQSMD